ncbi:hypothetical protein G5I_03553 [Acromyrmex echinatior]|uniref:Uncharacterized protein n=1 Tax=Acromyrmex echinatior TaxID=103372 RepID=F4WDA0_ACREC|nr:hypothetical protein G5I_03553 [Acromyrmex echinatior]
MAFIRFGSEEGGESDGRQRKREKEWERLLAGLDTIENGTLGDFSSRKLPPVLCGISSRVFTPDWEKTGRTLPSRPMELLNSSIHCSKGKKNQGGIVHWKRERTRWGGLTGTTTVAVTTFVDDVKFWKSDLLSLKEAHYS